MRQCCGGRRGSGRRRCGWRRSRRLLRAATGCCRRGRRRRRRGSRSQGSPTCSALRPARSSPSCRRCSGGRSSLLCSWVSPSCRPTSVSSRRRFWDRCGCSPPTARSAWRSTTCSGWTRASLAALRFALSRLDRRAARRPHRRPGWRAGLASPRRARATAADDPCRRPQCRRDPRAAPRPPRRHLRAADPAQDLGDLARQPLLRARAGSCAPAPGRHARPGRAAPDPLRPRPAPAGAPRRPQPRGAGRCPRRRRARRPDRAARRGCRRAPGRAGLAETLAARILELDGERLRFTHPLLGTAVSGASDALSPSLAARAARAARPHGRGTGPPPRSCHGRADARDRRHARGGRPSGLQPRRSHHCRRARRAGAQAHAQPPPAADARRRLFLAADLHHTAGDTARATALLTRARAEAAPGVERAEVLVQLAAVQPEPREAQALYRAGARRGGGRRRPRGDDSPQARRSDALGGGRVARCGPRRPRRPGSFADRRRRAQMSRARVPRGLAVESRTRPSPRRDGRGGRARAGASGTSARERPDHGALPPAGVDGRSRGRSAIAPRAP